AITGKINAALGRSKIQRGFRLRGELCDLRGRTWLIPDGHIIDPGGREGRAVACPGADRERNAGVVIHARAYRGALRYAIQVKSASAVRKRDRDVMPVCADDSRASDE